jgi:hypothetical protein
MYPVRHISRLGLSCSSTEHNGDLGPRDGHRLRLTVVFSTPEGTLAALRAARNLASNLGARILLLVPQAVPLPFPLEQPPIAIHYLEERQLSLVAASGIDAEEINIAIYLCRNRKECLRDVLRTRSLVVIGGERHWWFGKEQKLEQYLQTLGHQVVFVELEEKPHAGSFLRFHLRPVFRRLLDLCQSL